MNIYIYNCSNTLNYGAMMMGENFISYIEKQLKEDNNIYYIETEESFNATRLQKATSISNIYPTHFNSLFSKGTNKLDYICGYLGIKKVVSSLTDEIDLVVVLGGDDFTEDYGWRGPIFNAVKFNILKRNGLKVAMLGQTMGPYHSFRKPIMQRLLKRIDKIYPRDPLTFDYLKKLGLKNISLTDDLALLSLVKQNSMTRTKEYITYCPSELIYRYSKTGKREDWIEFNLFMIEQIMCKYPDKKLVLLAHVLKPEHVDDRKIVNELYGIIKVKHKDRIIVVNSEIYPYEVRNYIQQSLFVISSRMHPIVSSIQCEIPAIALSYSDKYWGIIGERYELEDYILDVRYLSYNEMRERLIVLMDKIDNKYENIQNQMREKNKLAEKSIMRTLEEIINLD